ncbi:MAG: diacylglycerol kinase [Christensenellaceae bacterium]|nr:diacylglycerol kinase [Christensenellaceae bacterium]
MKFINSVNHAFEGIVHAFRSEKNMRIHIVTALLVVIAAVLTYCTRYEMIALAITITFVFFAEMINTAVEAVVDLVTDKYHEMAKIAKNVAAGAVLLSALNALVVGYLVFYRKISNFSFTPINYMVNLPAHLTFAALVVVTLVVIIIKAKSVKWRGSYIHGGMPSGHSALAFSLFTAMAILGKDAVITSFSVIMAMLVAESRLETNVHTFTEVAVGALLGILITVILFQLSNMLML